MPELPEVQTTVNGLNETIIGLYITDIWSSYNSSYFKGSDNIKDLEYFKYFKKEVLGKKIVKATRRAKNILIHLNNGRTILIHMKMTGHIMYGKYNFNPKNKKFPWEPVEPESLKDPYNRHIRLIFTLSNKKYLALCDSRRFAKVTLIADYNKTEHLKDIGPEPLDKSFTFEKFIRQLNVKPNREIKRVITDQEIIAGIGNIYADESLWRASIHPSEKVVNIKSSKLKDLYEAIKKNLSKGIDLGGDSTSDYRNIHGERGHFHETHNVYRRKGAKCPRPGCGGTITRIVLGTRGTHFCNKHQVLSKS